MSFGFSLSDIELACKLAYKVYDRCFTKANGASESNTRRVVFIFTAKILESRDLLSQASPLSCFSVPPKY